MKRVTKVADYSVDEDNIPYQRDTNKHEISLRRGVKITKESGTEKIRDIPPERKNIA